MHFPYLHLNHPTWTLLPVLLPIIFLCFFEPLTLCLCPVPPPGTGTPLCIRTPRPAATQPIAAISSPSVPLTPPSALSQPAPSVAAAAVAAPAPAPAGRTVSYTNTGRFYDFLAGPRPVRQPVPR